MLGLFIEDAIVHNLDCTPIITLWSLGLDQLEYPIFLGGPNEQSSIEI